MLITQASVQVIKRMGRDGVGMTSGPSYAWMINDCNLKIKSTNKAQMIFYYTLASETSSKSKSTERQV